MLLLVIHVFSIESLKECKNNDHTCLFQCINISRVSRKQFEPSAANFLEPRQMLMHEKTCMIPLFLGNSCPLPRCIKVTHQWQKEIYLELN